MTRQTLDLTGLWRCQPDPFDEGEEEGYWRVGCDVRQWRETTVPGSFELCAPGMESYEGTVWYRRAFAAPPSWEGRHVVLRFEGANYHARVWVNGAAAGEHGDGFLPFELPVTGLLRCGGDNNVVVVRVDNCRRAGEVPGRERGWRPYGGILRELELVASDPLRIEGARVTAEPGDGAGAMCVQARLVNGRQASADARLAVSVLDAGGQPAGEGDCRAMAAPGAVEELSVGLRIPGARAWSPDRPVLYTARLVLSDGAEEADAVDVRFGFRRVEARGGRLLVNGEPVFLSGFNRHEDSPAVGMCTDLEAARRDLEAMKQAGANFVRLCHYPHHPGELALCDEIGLFAMGEIPLYFWEGLPEGERECAAKVEAAGRQLRNMIERDFNHPSIILWSVSNESREQRPEVVKGNEELVRLVRSLDPTRLATHVSDRWTQHPHFDRDDVVCVNGYPTWGGSIAGQRYDFEGSARFWREELAKLHALYPDKPVLVTEFGYPCFEGVRGGTIGEDMQARAIEAEFAGMAAPYVCGAAVWCWADHPWPEESFLRYVTTSPFGVLTRRRLPKEGFYVVRRLFREQRGLAEAAPSAGEEFPAGRMVNMVRPHLRGIPDVRFPAGFGIRSMRPGEASVWTDIQRDAEPFLDDITDELFYREFGSDLPATARRCFFIVDDRGVAVGTLSAWYDRDFKGQDHGRIHWVAVRPAYRRRGLAKAGMSYALQRMAEWHERAYLVTQTKRLPAIRMYLDFGFVPDLEPDGARQAWREVREQLPHPLLASLGL